MEKAKILRVVFAEECEYEFATVSSLLDLLGIDVVAAQTWSAARNFVKFDQFDLYLFDFEFANRKGIELCRIIREFQPLKPIVYYSKILREVDLQACITAGAAAIIQKPMINDLCNAITGAIKIV